MFVGSTLTVQDIRSTSTITIVLPEHNERATSSSLKVGDEVFIAGDLDDGVITAYGVRKIRGGSGTKILLDVPR